MKTIQIEKDIRIPGTNLILERGDTISFKSRSYSHSVRSSLAGNRKRNLKIPKTSLEIIAGDRIFISDAPENNELFLEEAKEFKGWNIGGLFLKPTVRSEIVNSDINIEEFVSYPWEIIKKGCLVAVVTPSQKISVKKVTQLTMTKRSYPEEGPLRDFLIKDREERIMNCETIPEIHSFLFSCGFSTLPLRDWKLSGKILTTGFDELKRIAFKFYLD